MHKSELVDPALSGVAETLLIPLYNRAMESQRPDAIMKDEKAVAIVTQMSYDFDQVRKIRMHEANKAARIMLTCEIDRYALDFLGRHPEFYCHRSTPIFFNVRQPKKSRPLVTHKF